MTNKILKFFFKKEVDKLNNRFCELQDEIISLRHEHSALLQEHSASQVDKFNKRFCELQDEIISLRQEHGALCRYMLRRLLLPAGGEQKGSETVKHSEVLPVIKDIEYYYGKLQVMAPVAFKVWRELVDVNERTYQNFPIHSCSVDGHVAAEVFRLFIQPYLCGRVLDIGCGPQSIPAYLKKYPCHLISGVDPISSSQDHQFNFVNGLAEFLPWPDGFFEIAIAATSLDHVLLLERVYDEVRRVLVKGGRFLVWVAFVKGAEQYDPFKPDIKPVDKYHLFHFDKAWFEKSIEPFFVIDEVLRVNIEIDHYFYNLLPRHD